MALKSAFDPILSVSNCPLYNFHAEHNPTQIRENHLDSIPIIPEHKEKTLFVMAANIIKGGSDAP
jgi:hypothetical protein